MSKAERHNESSKRWWWRKKINEEFGVDADRGLTLDELKALSKSLKMKKALTDVKQKGSDARLYTSDDNKEANKRDRDAYDKSVSDVYAVLEGIGQAEGTEGRGLLYDEGGEVIHIDGGQCDYVFDGSGLWKRDTLEEKKRKEEEENSKQVWRF